MREIVTLQVGHYANFVGTHWWNLQEAGFRYDPGPSASPIDPDVLFREGRNLQGDVTYTPRLILFDLKGSLKSLKQTGVLYDSQLTEPRMNTNVSLHQAAPYIKNEFLSDLDALDETKQGESSTTNNSQLNQPMETIDGAGSLSCDAYGSKLFGSKYYNLDTSVSVWSDYLRIHLHPRSIYLINSFNHDSNDDGFDVSTYGLSIMDDPDVTTHIDDRLHYFIEECDSLQGIHMIVDLYNGFGGFGSRLLQYLNDDYSPKSVLTFSVSPVQSQANNKLVYMKQMLCTGLSLTDIASSSSLVIPLSLHSNLANQQGTVSFPHLSYKAELSYHTSAILAAALDTVTSPYRLRQPTLSLTSLTNSLNVHSRKIGSLSSCLPLPWTPTSTLHDVLDKNPLPSLWQSLTPLIKSSVKPAIQSVVARCGLLPKADRVHTQAPNPHDALTQYLSKHYPVTLNASCCINEPLSTKAPYPHIFSQNIDTHGYFQEKGRPSSQGVESVSCVTSLQSNSSVSRLLRHLHTHATQTNLNTRRHFISAKFEHDDFLETLTKLQTLADNY